MIQFYAPDILATHELPESDSAHCARVLRLHEGDNISVVDGKGHRYTCVITSSHHKHTTVEVLATEAVPKIWHGSVTVAIAPPKNIDRLEWFAEKAVEIGIDRIVLLRCEHSERKEVRADRIVKIMVSAMKQSLKAVMPQLVPMMPFSQFVTPGDGSRFMGYCDSNTPRQPFADVCPVDKDVTVLIGPEGDFSPAEVEKALAAGYMPVTFGDNRLRTETAALFALSTFHIVEQLKSLR